MSYKDVYAYVEGEYQTVTRIAQVPVSNALPAFFTDLNLVAWAGFDNELWSAETGGIKLVEGLDYELQYIDVSAIGPVGEAVYAGYSILTPAYYDVPLYQTANIVGAYTTRPYRPSTSIITSDSTVNPISMDDSVIADASGGSFTLAIDDGFQLNQRYSVICKGSGTVTISGAGIAGEPYSGTAVSYIWDGTEWIPLQSPSQIDGGYYWNWVEVYRNTLAINPSVQIIPEWGDGIFYAAVNFDYQGTLFKTSGTIPIFDDGIDRYSILAIDVVGGSSTLNLQYDGTTKILTVVETGADFTNIDLTYLYKWEQITINGFGAWANTVEAPPYGEAIVSGQELYLDGTKEFVSSDGNAPVVDVVDYLPAVINVDGSETPEANSKWPGQRGTYGFFSEYENVVIPSDYTLASASLDNEGTWSKLSCTTGGNNSEVKVSFNTGVTDLTVSVMLRKGTALFSQIYAVQDAGNPYGRVEWSGPSITFHSGAVDAGSYVIGDIAFVSFTFSGSASTGSPEFRIRGSEAATSVTNDYMYFKEWMAVEDISYPVPYHPGTSPASKLQYNFDWASSDEWTIEGWVNQQIPVVAGVYQALLYCGSVANDLIYIDSDPTGKLRLVSYKSSTPEVVISSSVTTANTWFHFKIVLISSTSAALYVNGALIGTATTSVPDFADLEKITFIGSNLNYAETVNGYIQDLRISPTADTSTTHYTSGLPYYNPNKTYGKNASWSIDERGNVSGNNQVAGVIIFDGEINGQWVTRWDTGRMVITYRDTLDVTTSTANIYGTTSGDIFTGAKDDTVAVPFLGDVFSVVGGSTAYGYRMYDAGTIVHIDLYFTASTARAYWWTATGRWK